VLHPILQPRFAMGMAMTILSFAMLARWVAPARQLRPADLSPTQVWAGLEDRVYRGWQRTVKFYESLKVVYQIQSKLHDWQQQQEEEPKPADTEKSGRRPEYAPAASKRNVGPSRARKGAETLGDIL
jgi:hypothetical protein